MCGGKCQTNLQRTDEDPASDELARGTKCMLGNEWQPELDGVMFSSGNWVDSGHKVLKTILRWARIASWSAVSMVGRHSDKSQVALQSPNET